MDNEVGSQSCVLYYADKGCKRNKVIDTDIDIIQNYKL